ncbi:MAG: restriction endonuclease subunit S [Rhodoferax sp.]|nr:restriction endonuclease subunit S [Rhodoferax sp.]
MLLSNLNVFATAPGGVARLRELILTLAVQGKLVPQDPKDEPASALLKKIRAEKDRLIAEGKIKRDKPLAEVGEEEKPFALPRGWKWQTLTEVGAWAIGSGFPHEAQGRGGLPILFAKVSDMNLPGNELEIVRTNHTIDDETVERLRINVHQAGTVIFPKIGGAIATNKRRVLVRPTAIDNNCLGITPSAAMSTSYLFLLLSSIDFTVYQAGTSVPALSQGTLGQIPVGLPPFAEQSRIVTRVEELMRLCDALEAKGQLEATQHARLVSTLLATLTESETPAQLADNWHRIATHFDLLLDRPEAVDALEQTILQLAVRGLLVPQDPQDEPASVLLKKIRAEKDKLVAEGKIKRDKPLPPIAEDEQPFVLPKGWSWARFPELGEFGRGKSKHRPRNDPALFNPPKYSLIQTGEVSRAKGVVQEVHSYYSDLGLAQSRMWPKGTLCITIAANIAESAVLGFDSCFPDSVVGFVPADAMGNVEYFLLFVETARADLLAFAPATAQKNINLEILSSLIIPVPPMNELTRIATRVGQLRRLCADLRQRLTASQSTQAHLAEALVDTVASGLPVA